MSLNFIYKFQLKIYQSLVESELLKQNVKEICLSAIQDGNYPFILINFLNIYDKSNLSLAIYSVEFEICIFSRDRNKKNLLIISDLVDGILVPKNLGFQGYNITGIRLNNLSFDLAKDLVHNKLTMTYKSMIKKELL